MVCFLNSAEEPSSMAQQSEFSDIIWSFEQVKGSLDDDITEGDHHFFFFFFFFLLLLLLPYPFIWPINDGPVFLS